MCTTQWSLYVQPGSTMLRSAHAVYLCVLCESENKQRLFPYTALTDWFLGEFEKFHKATISFVMSVRLSVRPSAQNNLPTKRGIFMKFNILVFFSKIS